jgi:hypothetical protein
MSKRKIARKRIEMGTCDNCHRAINADNLHNLLYPVEQADFDLQVALHIEEAQAFCPRCLTQIERDADALQPEWSERHRGKAFRVK